ncbi:MAG: DeoR/GlpR family DNA-binding transcription regulator [Coprobacillaceae bacterium]
MIDRHTKILDLLSEHKKIEVAKLSELLGVSQVTIRKDLGHLEGSGIIVREHGYAVLNSSDDINNRLAYNYNTKQEIAKLATDMVMDGETIMIESGSCCALLALEIAQTKRDVTLITNSAFIADYVRKVSKTKTIVLGGEYQNESQVMVGPITRKCAEAFFVDKLFIGADGFSKITGFTGNDYMRAVAVRDMAKQADKVVVVTESAKFTQKGIVSLLQAKEIHAVITDNDIPKESEEYLLQNEVVVKKINQDT